MKILIENKNYISMKAIKLIFVAIATLSILSCDSEFDYSDSIIEFSYRKYNSSEDTVIKNDTNVISDPDVIVEFLTQSSLDNEIKIYVKTNKIELTDNDDVYPRVDIRGNVENKSGYRYIWEVDNHMFSQYGDTIYYKVVIGTNILSDELVVVRNLLP